jgi:hypothetical protein
MEGVLNMPNVIFKDIGINLLESQTVQEYWKNSLVTKKSLKESKNSELSKIMWIKKNKNIYIPLQLIFKKRRCL